MSGHFAYWLIGAAIVLGVVGLLLILKLGHRRKAAARGQSGLFVVQGLWRKTYTRKGSERVEEALIKGNAYYVEGDKDPQYWLRNVVFDPRTREIRFEMVLALDGRRWDTEKLVLSHDRQSMSGRSEMTGSAIWYEKAIEDS
jgi:hypothetical protein